MIRICYIVLVCLCIFQDTNGQQNYSGFVYDASTKEPLIGAVGRSFPQGNFFQTDRFGYFSFGGNKIDSIQFTHLGYRSQTVIKPEKTMQLLVNMAVEASVLSEAVVLGKTLKNKLNIGKIELTAQEINLIPALGGEKDAIKAIQFLPGVQKGAEGSTSLYVRGGSADQNLILIDEAVVYNPNHFFGFFSTFNTDAIKKIDFYKSGSPAEFGGRLSSTITVQQKEGNKQQLAGTGTIGILSSKITLEGPLKKNKSSFVVAGRRTNLDPILNLISNDQGGFKYRFYDLNAKLSFQLNDKNKFYMSGFASDDALRVLTANKSETNPKRNNSDLKWGNQTLTANWFSIIKSNLNLSLIGTYTNFSSGIFVENNTGPIENPKVTSSSYYGSGIKDANFKLKVNRFVNENREQEVGVFGAFRLFQPKLSSIKSFIINVDSVNKQELAMSEAGFFLTEKRRIGSATELNYGLRFTNIFVTNKTYQILEPRLSLVFRQSENNIFKLSADRSSQFVNLIQSSGYGLSTDLYLPATAQFRPQVSNQLALSYERKLANGRISVVAETYAKKQTNILAFKEGVSIFLIGDDVNPIDWERNLTAGQALTYGFETMARKQSGKLTGWISYTLASATVRFEELNNGKPFRPFQDRRHDVSIVLNRELSRRWRVSANWVFTTGTPITLPVGYYGSGVLDKGNAFDLATTNYYGLRNGFRMPVYHRLDASVSYTKVKRKLTSVWELGVFNAYNRNNPFNAYLKTDFSAGQNTLKVAYSSLLPIVPSISYGFKF